ncbi:hypothetical protein [Photobacterium leiognathi]|uniref:hypothetical protein n=1 Tax=Photobacterium leiognathi TaxID=553611 RepID=UPI0029820540|nr:hypothetical protein [Photobacterium leiognathi]
MFSEYLPITVTVTLILFITREIIDLIKKHREKKRLIRSLKILLSEELKDNYYALKNLYRVLEFVNRSIQAYKEQIEVNKQIKTDRFGNNLVTIAIGKGAENGFLQMPFPKLSTKRYDAYIKEIATLDFSLYEEITIFYKKLRYCEKIRCEVIEYLELENHMNWAFDFRVEYMLEQKEEYEQTMQKLHAMLIKKHMEIKRDEVIDINI